MIQFRTVLLIQLHYEFSSRDIPGCQEFFLCDTCIQLTVRAAYALQDRVLTDAALFLFLLCCAIFRFSRFLSSPETVSKKLCSYKKQRLPAVTSRILMAFIQGSAVCFWRFQQPPVEGGKQNAVYSFHTHAHQLPGPVPMDSLQEQARSPSLAPSLFLFMNHFLQLTILVTASIQSSLPSERGVGRTGDVQSAR